MSVKTKGEMLDNEKHKGREISKLFVGNLWGIKLKLSIRSGINIILSPHAIFSLFSATTLVFRLPLTSLRRVAGIDDGPQLRVLRDLLVHVVVLVGLKEEPAGVGQDALAGTWNV